MADNKSGQSKTEPPTQKRLRDLRRKGQVAKSRDVPATAVVIAGVAFLALAGHLLIEGISAMLDEAADFHDHHPYAELHHLPGLLDHFSPCWRPRRPWVFGEFADSDAFRDPRTLADADGRRPWWTSADPDVNPQGARWAMEVTGFADALERGGSGARGDELRRVSDAASLLLRRFRWSDN